MVEGVTGTLVRPQDPAALAAATAGLLADPERRAAYGAAGRLRVLDHYSWDRIAAGTADVYARTAWQQVRDRSAPVPVR